MMKLSDSVIDSNMTKLELNVWNAYQSLKGELETKDFSFFLFMLSLQKDNAFRNIRNEYEPYIKDEIRDCVAQNSGAHRKIYLKLHDLVFKYFIKKISDSTLMFLINKLSEIDRDLLSKNFSNIFDNL
jgi:hypothetical protein